MRPIWRNDISSFIKHLDVVEKGWTVQRLLGYAGKPDYINTDKWGYCRYEVYPTDEKAWYRYYEFIIKEGVIVNIFGGGGKLFFPNIDT